MTLLSGARLLVLKKSDQISREIPVRTDQVKFGTHPLNTIRFKESNGVDRLHCKIFVKNDKVLVVNYSAEHPINVDGAVVTKRAVLNDGAILDVCGTRFRWQFDDSKLLGRVDKIKKPIEHSPTAAAARRRRTTMVRKKHGKAEPASGSGQKQPVRKSQQKTPTFTLPKTHRQLLKNIRKRFTVHNIANTDDSLAEDILDDEPAEGEQSAADPPEPVTPTKSLGIEQTDLQTEASLPSPISTTTPQKATSAASSTANTPFYTPELDKENLTPVAKAMTPKTPLLQLQNSSTMILSYTPAIGTPTKTSVRKTPLSAKVTADRFNVLTPKNQKSANVSRAGSSMFLIDLTTPTSHHASFVCSPKSDKSSVGTPSTVGTPVRLIDLTSPSPQKIRTPPTSNMPKNVQKTLLRSALKNASKTPTSVRAAGRTAVTPKSVPKIKLNDASFVKSPMVGTPANDASFVKSPMVGTPATPKSRVDPGAATDSGASGRSSRTPLRISRSNQVSAEQVLAKSSDLSDSKESSAVEAPLATESTDSVSSDVAHKEAPPVMTTDELFDTLVGRQSIKRTYERKSTSPQKLPSALVVAEETSELPKTDIDLWVESVVAAVTSPDAVDINSVLRKPNRTTQVRSSQYSDITPHESFADVSGSGANDSAAQTVSDQTTHNLDENELRNLGDHPSIPSSSRRSETPLTSKIVRSLDNKRQTIGNFFTNIFGKLTVSPVTRVSIVEDNTSDVSEPEQIPDAASDGSEDVYHDSETNHEELGGQPEDQSNVVPSPKLRQSLRDTRKFIGNALISLNTSRPQLDNTAEIDESLLLNETYGTTGNADDAECYNLTDLSNRPTVDIADCSPNQSAKVSRSGSVEMEAEDRDADKDHTVLATQELSPSPNNSNNALNESPAPRQRKTLGDSVESSPLAVPLEDTPVKITQNQSAVNSSIMQEISPVDGNRSVTDKHQDFFISPAGSSIKRFSKITTPTVQHLSMVRNADSSTPSRRSSRRMFNQQTTTSSTVVYGTPEKVDSNTSEQPAVDEEITMRDTLPDANRPADIAANQELTLTKSAEQLDGKIDESNLGDSQEVMANKTSDVAEAATILPSLTEVLPLAASDKPSTRKSMSILGSTPKVYTTSVKVPSSESKLLIRRTGRLETETLSKFPNNAARLIEKSEDDTDEKGVLPMKTAADSDEIVGSHKVEGTPISNKRTGSASCEENVAAPSDLMANETVNSMEQDASLNLKQLYKTPARCSQLSSATKTDSAGVSSSLDDTNVTNVSMDMGPIFETAAETESHSALLSAEPDKSQSDSTCETEADSFLDISSLGGSNVSGQKMAVSSTPFIARKRESSGKTAGLVSPMHLHSVAEIDAETINNTNELEEDEPSAKAQTMAWVSVAAQSCSNLEATISDGVFEDPLGGQGSGLDASHKVDTPTIIAEDASTMIDPAEENVESGTSIDRADLQESNTTLSGATSTPAASQLADLAEKSVDGSSQVQPIPSPSPEASNVSVPASPMLDALFRTPARATRARTTATPRSNPKVEPELDAVAASAVEEVRGDSPQVRHDSAVTLEETAAVPILEEAIDSTQVQQNPMPSPKTSNLSIPETPTFETTSQAQKISTPTPMVSNTSVSGTPLLKALFKTPARTTRARAAATPKSELKEVDVSLVEENRDDPTQDQQISTPTSKTSNVSVSETPLLKTLFETPARATPKSELKVVDVSVVEDNSEAPSQPEQVSTPTSKTSNVSVSGTPMLETLFKTPARATRTRAAATPKSELKAVAVPVVEANLNDPSQAKQVSTPVLKTSDVSVSGTPMLETLFKTPARTTRARTAATPKSEMKAVEVPLVEENLDEQAQRVSTPASKTSNVSASETPLLKTLFATPARATRARTVATPKSELKTVDVSVVEANTDDSPQAQQVVTPVLKTSNASVCGTPLLKTLFETPARATRARAAATPKSEVKAVTVPVDEETRDDPTQDQQVSTPASKTSNISVSGTPLLKTLFETPARATRARTAATPKSELKVVGVPVVEENPDDPSQVQQVATPVLKTLNASVSGTPLLESLFKTPARATRARAAATPKSELKADDPSQVRQVTTPALKTSNVSASGTPMLETLFKTPVPATSAEPMHTTNDVPGKDVTLEDETPVAETSQTVAPLLDVPTESDRPPIPVDSSQTVCSTEMEADGSISAVNNTLGISPALLEQLSERVVALEYEMADLTNCSTNYEESQEESLKSTSNISSSSDDVVKSTNKTHTAPKRRLYTKTEPEDETPQKRKSILQPANTNIYAESSGNGKKPMDRRRKRKQQDSPPTEDEHTEQAKKVLPSRASKRNIKTLSEEALAGESPVAKYVKPKNPTVDSLVSNADETAAQPTPEIETSVDQHDPGTSLGRRKVMFNEQIQVKQINSPAPVGDIIKKIPGRGRGRSAKQGAQAQNLKQAIKPEENAVMVPTDGAAVTDNKSVESKNDLGPTETAKVETKSCLRKTRGGTTAKGAPDESHDSQQDGLSSAKAADKPTTANQVDEPAAKRSKRGVAKVTKSTERTTTLAKEDSATMESAPTSSDADEIVVANEANILQEVPSSKGRSRRVTKKKQVEDGEPHVNSAEAGSESDVKKSKQQSNPPPKRTLRKQQATDSEKNPTEPTAAVQEEKNGETVGLGNAEPSDIHLSEDSNLKTELPETEERKPIRRGKRAVVKPDDKSSVDPTDSSKGNRRRAASKKTSESSNITKEDTAGQSSVMEETHGTQSMQGHSSINTPEMPAPTQKRGRRAAKNVVEKTVEESLNESHMIKTILPTSHTSTPLTQDIQPRSRGKRNPVIAELIEEDTPRTRGRTGNDSKRQNDSNAVDGSVSSPTAKRARGRTAAAKSKLAEAQPDQSERTEESAAQSTSVATENVVSVTSVDDATEQQRSTSSKRTRKLPAKLRNDGEVLNEPKTHNEDDSEVAEQVSRSQRGRKAKTVKSKENEDTGTMTASVPQTKPKAARVKRTATKENVSEAMVEAPQDVESEVKEAASRNQRRRKADAVVAKTEEDVRTTTATEPQHAEDQVVSKAKRAKRTVGKAATKEDPTTSSQNAEKIAEVEESEVAKPVSRNKRGQRAKAVKPEAENAAGASTLTESHHGEEATEPKTAGAKRTIMKSDLSEAATETISGSPPAKRSRKGTKKAEPDQTGPDDAEGKSTESAAPRKRAARSRK